MTVKGLCWVKGHSDTLQLSLSYYTKDRSLPVEEQSVFISFICILDNSLKQGSLTWVNAISNIKQ